jgi:hypothetical protein
VILSVLFCEVPGRNLVQGVLQNEIPKPGKLEASVFCLKRRPLKMKLDVENKTEFIFRIGLNIWGKGKKVKAYGGVDV